MTTKERLARIIDPHCWNYGDLPRPKMEIELAQRRLDAGLKAEAILTELMEPDGDLQYVGGAAQQKSCGSYGEPGVVFRAMIQAILDEEGG